MLLALLAGLIVVGALIWLGVALVRTWKLVAKVGRGVAEAGDRLAEATAGSGHLLVGAPRRHLEREAQPPRPGELSHEMVEHR